MSYLKLVVFIICAVLFTYKSTAQNLVPNGSFEEYNDSCTNTIDPGYFENVKAWLPKRYLQGYFNAAYSFGIPGYYSSCVPFLYSYPPLIASNGFQYPNWGNSFTGIGLDLSFGTLDRTSIRVQLKQPLQSGVCYHAEMYCNKHNNAGWVHNKLGMVFTTDSFAMSYDGSLPYPTPQVYTNDFIYDTLNWVKIEGNFIANGGEEWLTIGWMFDSTEIAFDSVPGGSGLQYSYYYIDAVKVNPCTDDEEAIQLPNFISPNGDGKNDFYVIDSLPPQSRVGFFNRWGNEVYSSNDYQNDWNGTHNGAPLPTGTYFVVVQMPHGTKKSTFIELMY